MTWSEGGGAVSRDSELPRMTQSTGEAPQYLASPILKVQDSGEGLRDMHTHLRLCRHQNASSSVVAVGSKTLLGAE